MTATSSGNTYSTHSPPQWGILACGSVELGSGQDDLHGGGVSSVWHWVIHDADGPHHLSTLLSLAGEVGRVSNHHFGFRDLPMVGLQHNLVILLLDYKHFKTRAACAEEESKTD